MNDKNRQPPVLSDVALERVMRDVLGLWPLAADLANDDLMTDTADLGTEADNPEEQSF
ncbi:MAG: hypothetical protein KZQ93_12390 [Candidatus Thiodiazotropha sp. (ex Monitilora ramsayi)]|nr:hypothetical protein [Candidatus Thiodiazotropha sp. (ex Monitilora ramsayi)]